MLYISVLPTAPRHHNRLAQVSAATLLANLSSLPAPGGDSIADPADTLRDMNAFLGLLVYVPEPTTAEGLATLLSLKVGGIHQSASSLFPPHIYAHAVNEFLFPTFFHNFDEILCSAQTKALGTTAEPKFFYFVCGVRRSRPDI